MSVIDEIAAERRRQVEAEGWTPEHDDEHGNAELAAAAAAYIRHAANFTGIPNSAGYRLANVPAGWPWHVSWWKPIVAEIERLDRATTPTRRTP
jgi:hypothetical protein